MADARIIIEGRIVTDPRFNTSKNGDPVANLRVLAGRSRKNDKGGYDTLSETAYNVAFWREHAQLVDMLRPEKGSSVVVSGTVTGVEKYDGQQGESLSVTVSGEGLRVFPKRDQGQQSQQGGYGQRYAGDHPGGPNGYQQEGAWTPSPGPAPVQADPWAGSQPQTDEPPF